MPTIAVTAPENLKAGLWEPIVTYQVRSSAKNVRQKPVRQVKVPIIYQVRVVKGKDIGLKYKTKIIMPETVHVTSVNVMLRILCANGQKAMRAQELWIISAVMAIMQHVSLIVTV